MRSGEIPLQSQLDQYDQRPPPEDWPTQRRMGGHLPRMLIGAVLGVALGVLAYISLAPYSVYSVKGRIEIVCDSDRGTQQALGRHVLALQLRRPTWSSGNYDRRQGDELWMQLADQYHVQCTSSLDSSAIVLSTTGKLNCREQIQRLQQDYVGRFNLYSESLAAEVQRQQKALAARRKQLRQQLARCTDQINSLLQQIDTKELPAAAASVVDDLRILQQANQRCCDNLTALTLQLQRTRSQVTSPVVSLNADVLSAALMADKFFATDSQALTIRHKIYMDNLKQQIAGVSEQVTAIGGGLQRVCATIAGQLQVDLHEKLADDLLELKIACELYHKRLSDFEDQFSVYLEQVLPMLAEPLDARINDAESVLIQLRGQFEKDCGQLGKQLDQLHKQLTGATTVSQAGALARLTVRAVVSSAVSPDLTAIVRRFELLQWYLQRMCAENNVEMLTIGRSIGGLQVRASARKQEIHKQLYRQARQLAIQRAQHKLLRLQSEYQGLAQSFTENTNMALELQKRGLTMFQVYPKWGGLTEKSDQLQRQLAQLDMQIKSLGNDDNATSEILRAGAVKSRLVRKSQMPLAVRLALSILVSTGGFALGMFGSKLIFWHY